uniref:Dockerin domain-containing protein n=1 Tax=Candidatus Methanogaster sp. ANME-2c ERB4 TaxID=2759911 RepID=A0A7G9YEC1_9EURY|nr:hypothetical protein KJPMONCH_00004 [Methanosarcinales archaeon ANME-2c ERB4]
METGWTFAAIGCTIAQVGNIAKNVGGTTVGCFDDKRLVEGKSKDSADMGICLMFLTRSCDLNSNGILTPADAAIALRLAATGGWDPAADVNRDSRITSLGRAHDPAGGG